MKATLGALPGTPSVAGQPRAAVGGTLAFGCATQHFQCGNYSSEQNVCNWTHWQLQGKSLKEKKKKREILALEDSEGNDIFKGI